MSKCLQNFQHFTLGNSDAFERITQLLYICFCMCFSLFVVMFFNSAVTYTFNNTTETETFTIYGDRSQQNIEAHYPNTRVLVVSINLFHRTSCSHKLHLPLLYHTFFNLMESFLSHSKIAMPPGCPLTI